LISSLFEGQSDVQGRIVEATWSQTRNQWTLVRLRDDKRFPNHKDVVCEIMKSIKDGVDLEVVSSREAASTDDDSVAKDTTY